MILEGELPSDGPVSFKYKFHLRLQTPEFFNVHVVRPLCLLSGSDGGIDVFEKGREKLEGIWRDLDAVVEVEEEIEKVLDLKVEEVEVKEDKLKREREEEDERRQKLVQSEESASKKQRKKRIIM
jgi:hypothetical protein